MPIGSVMDLYDLDRSQGSVIYLYALGDKGLLCNGMYLYALDDN